MFSLQRLTTQFASNSVFMSKHVYCVSMLPLANKHLALSIQCIMVFFRKHTTIYQLSDVSVSNLSSLISPSSLTIIGKYFSLLIIALKFFTRGNIFKLFYALLKSFMILSLCALSVSKMTNVLFIARSSVKNDITAEGHHSEGSAVYCGVFNSTLKNSCTQNMLHTSIFNY